MQTGCRLIKNIQGAAGVSFRKLARKLGTLRLAPRQCSSTLPKRDIGKTDVCKRIELAFDRRHGVEKYRCILDRHTQHLMNVFAFIANLERLPVVTFTLTPVARNVNIREEVHLHLYQAIAMTGLAAAAAHVERKAPGIVAARPRLRRRRKEFANGRKKAGIGGRV